MQVCERRFEAHKGHMVFFSQRMLQDILIRNLDGRIAEIRCQIRGLISNMPINFCDIPYNHLMEAKKWSVGRRASVRKRDN